MAIVRLVDLRGLLHRLGREPHFVAAHPVASRHLGAGHLALDCIRILDGDVRKSLGELQRGLALLFGGEQDFRGLAAVGFGEHGRGFLRLYGELRDCVGGNSIPFMPAGPDGDAGRREKRST
jgi:hypothetical protein